MKNIVKCSLLVVVGILFFASEISAEENWIDFGHRENVDIDKNWKVTFDQPMERGTLHSQSIYVKDTDGNQLFLSNDLSEDGKEMTVLPPADYYEPGEEYTLYIESEVESEEGNQMKEGYKLTFTVDPTQEKPYDLPEDSDAEFFGEVTASTLLVREETNTDSEIVGRVYEGDLIPVYDIDGFWVESKYEGETVFLHKDYLILRHKSGDLLKDITIVLDAGHGGYDNGASVDSPVPDIREKEITLPVTLKLRDNLEKLGANVILTREDDRYISLDDRVEFSLDHFNDLFVSIHANSFRDSSVNGVETFYSSTKDGNVSESEYLTTAIQNQIVSTVGMRHRRIGDAEFRVIHNNPSPATLVELGFMTNSKDIEKLIDGGYHQLFADAITQGIINYYR
ncbi:N-acetylmuramoyl-L-alanine amidase [Alkalibacillus aidingensis]|uniref:N-acetylmuramoyl-L-alanine amidase n=1 Tax=Alkalibacillus aidingensis TaxID=2747607 RepID=UPI0016608EB1|nr:N-acetylmuramoyl-L-alanine amidase [Alkalibacillus aidingensis]